MDVVVIEERIQSYPLQFFSSIGMSDWLQIFGRLSVLRNYTMSATASDRDENDCSEGSIAE